ARKPARTLKFHSLWTEALRFLKRFNQEPEWGESNTSSNLVEVTHTVTVPPMTKVTVNLIATKGYCDVPFTYSQTDTLYNGTTVTSEVEGGSYTGSNYYNIDFQTEEEGL
ncbi:hypothetical protein V6N11_007386, partial [Hibiscus sabdariffa]